MKRRSPGQRWAPARRLGGALGLLLLASVGAALPPASAAVAVRWDTADGRALVLARPPAGRTSAGPTGPQALDAWLVAFAQPLGQSTEQGAPR